MNFLRNKKKKTIFLIFLVSLIKIFLEFSFFRKFVKDFYFKLYFLRKKWKKQYFCWYFCNKLKFQLKMTFSNIFNHRRKQNVLFFSKLKIIMSNFPILLIDILLMKNEIFLGLGLPPMAKKVPCSSGKRQGPAL